MVALEPVLDRSAAGGGGKGARAQPARGGCGTSAAPTRRCVRELVERHLRFTGSTLALALLDDWDSCARQVREGVPARVPARADRDARRSGGARRETRRKAESASGVGPWARSRASWSCSGSRRRREPVAERVHHYREFILALADDAASKQGARCMDCGIPFCQTGCPVNNIIPDWNDLVYRQQWQTRARRRCTRPTTSPSSPDACARRRARRRARSTSTTTRSPSSRSSTSSSTRAGRKAGSCRSCPTRKTGQDASPSSAPGPAGHGVRAAARARGPRRRRSSRRPTASAACCATAFPTSRWRSTSSTGAWRRWRPRA